MSQIAVGQGGSGRVLARRVRGAPGPAVAVTGGVLPAPGATATVVAFCQYTSSAAQVFVINDDGTGYAQLTHDATYYGWVAWSPDGTRLAAASMDTGIVYILDPATGAVIQEVTNFDHTTANSGFWQGGWSPDGRQLALAGGARTREFIQVANIDNSGSVIIDSTGVSQRDNYCIAWSPDGQRIAYVKQSAYNAAPPSSPSNSYGTVVTAHPDGSGLTVVALADEQHDWIPWAWYDSNTLLIQQALGGFAHTGLWKSDGTTATQLVSDANSLSLSAAGSAVALVPATGELVWTTGGFAVGLTVLKANSQGANIYTAPSGSLLTNGITARGRAVASPALVAGQLAAGPAQLGLVKRPDYLRSHMQ